MNFSLRKVLCSQLPEHRLVKKNSYNLRSSKHTFKPIVFIGIHTSACDFVRVVFFHTAPNLSLHPLERLNFGNTIHVPRAYGWDCALYLYQSASQQFYIFSVNLKMTCATSSMIGGSDNQTGQNNLVFHVCVFTCWDIWSKSRDPMEETRELLGTYLHLTAEK